MPAAQSYANHRRFFPLLHFFVFPILVLNLVGAIIHGVHNPTSRYAILAIPVALALLGLALSARIMAIKLQDRLIRMEMRLRLERVLPQDSRARIMDLTIPQLVSLRFASDAELPVLVAKALAGGFPSAGAIKREIANWQPDHLRV